MASLGLLPMELLYAITSCGFGQDDLLSLRLTCKDLNAKLQEPHLDSTYKTRHLFLVPAGLQNLLKISRHPSGVNRRVRDLVIYKTSPYVEERRDRSAAFKAYEDLPGKKKRFMRDIYRQGEVGDGETRIQHSGSVCAVLTLIFKNLPNIRSIRHVQDATNVIFEDRTYFNLYYPGIRVPLYSKIPHIHPKIFDALIFYPVTEHEDYARRRMGLADTMYAAMLNDLSIESVTMDIMDGRGPSIEPTCFQLWHQQFRDITNPFGSLKVLHLTLDLLHRECDSPPPSIPYGNTQCWEIEVKRNPFWNWLDAVGGKLEDLAISDLDDPMRLEYYNHRSIRGRSFPALKGRFPHLTKISLAAVYLFVEDFKIFLKTHKDSLKHLDLVHCLFERPKLDWFEILQVIKAHLRLQRFRMLPVGATDSTLPALVIDGAWDQPGTVCSVYMHHWARRISEDEVPICFKNINQELEQHSEAIPFWDFISDGKWEETVRDEFDDFIEEDPSSSSSSEIVDGTAGLVVTHVPSWFVESDDETSQLHQDAGAFSAGNSGAVSSHNSSRGRQAYAGESSEDESI